MAQVLPLARAGLEEPSQPLAIERPLAVRGVCAGTAQPLSARFPALARHWRFAAATTAESSGSDPEQLLALVSLSGVVDPEDFLAIAATSAGVHRQVRVSWIELLNHVCENGTLPRLVPARFIRRPRAIPPPDPSDPEEVAIYELIYGTRQR